MPVVCRFAPSAHENRGPAGIIRTAVPRRGWRSTADHASLGGARQGGGNAGVLVSNRRALGGVHLRPLGAKFKFEALQFLNFGIRFYWVVVISGLSGQTSLENSRSKLEQLSNLVGCFMLIFPLSAISTFDTTSRTSQTTSLVFLYGRPAKIPTVKFFYRSGHAATLIYNATRCDDKTAVFKTNLKF